MRGIKTRGGSCGECKWFKPEPKLMKECAPYHFDGVCMNQKHTGGLRSLEYSHAGCCFDAEDPDGQLTIEEVFT